MNTNIFSEKHFVPGILSVEFIQFKNKSGGFKVGKLQLPFAEVEVKDKWLEAFDVGKYSGWFNITNVYIKPIRTKKGYIFNVLCAEVPEYQIEESLGDETVVGQQASPVEDEIERTDPAEEEKRNSARHQKPVSKPPTTQSTPSATGMDVPPGAKGDTQNQPAAPVQEPVKSEAESIVSIATAGQYQSQDDLPDEFEPDMSIGREELRELFKLINVNNGGQFKFNGGKLWIRQK